MESDRSLDVKEVGGINLDNYFPYQSSYNTVLYVHKRYSDNPFKEIAREITQKNKQKVEKKTVKIAKCDTKSSINRKEKNQGSVLQQTIKFAKDLVPLVIPPSEGGNTPVYYTVKTCTKCKNASHVEEKCEKLDDLTFEKKRSKKIAESMKKEKKNRRDSYSAESTAQSSQGNTLDDINMNQSLSCTLSELSDKKEKYHKNTVNNKRKKSDSNKFHVSESFEGLATELNDAGETKIKIQVMNEKEKHFLSESIKIPIVEAVNDCIKDFNITEIKEDIKTLQRLAMSNSQKLDSIFERLACIENYLVTANTRTPCSPKVKVRKPSRLEQLSEDLINEKEYSSEEELSKPNSNRQRDEITVLHAPRNERIDLGCGELSESKPSTSVGVKTERHRLPARFCWTDTERDK